jgi:ketosteroid isomerase-like protein
MIMKILTFVILTFAFAISIVAQTGAQQTKITADIRKVMDDQSAAWNSGDIDGFMSGYWRSEKLVFISGDNVTRGWQPTLDRYKKGYDSRAKMGTLKFSGLEFFPISKDAVIVLGSWELTREKDNPHGKFTLTFRKFKEGWRVVMDHTS